MSSSQNQIPPQGNDTYSTMSVGEVEAIGAHCQMPFCHQLDFLPFRCESCKGKFCLDHRSETAHTCPQAGAWARRRTEQLFGSSSGSSSRPGPESAFYKPPSRPSVLVHESQCSETSCKTLINTPLVTGVQCADCNRSYCLKHRFREDHDCARLAPVGARTQKEKGLAALEKLRAWGASKQKSAMTKAAPGSSASVARIRATADLKKTAKGDAKVPVEKRVYLHVEASKDTLSSKVPSGNFYYSIEWSVGRILDMAAKSLQVENVNNRGGGEEDKLRVFHVEGGRLLDFSEKLGTAVQTGNTLVLLRGVGPPVPDLIDMK